MKSNWLAGKWLLSLVLGMVAAYLFGGGAVGEPQRVARVAEMTPSEKEELRQKLERYQQLPTEERDRLHRLHDELHRQEDSAELQQVMREYYSWLKSLSAVERAELEKLPLQQRIGEIKLHLVKQERQQFAHQARQAMRELRFSPGDGDMETIDKWLNDWVVRHKEVIFAAEPQLFIHHPWLKRVNSEETPEDRKAFVYWAWMHWVPNLEVPRPSDEDFETLLGQLREETRRNIESQPDNRRRELLDGLVHAAVASHFHRRFHRTISTEDLREFYRENLTEKQQADLASLQPEQFEARLRQEYMKQRGSRNFGPRGPSGRGPRGPGPGGPGPRLDRDRDGGPRDRDERGDRNERDNNRPPAAEPGRGREGPRRGPPRPNQET